MKPKTYNILRIVNLIELQIRNSIVFAIRKKGGFTMVEMVIIIAILILISGILLANFPAFSRQVSLQRSSQNVALAMRKAQNMAFAVRQVGTVPPSIPFGFGLYFGPAQPSCPAAPPDSFFLYGDLDNDGLLRCPQDFIVETGTLESGTTFSQFIFHSGAVAEVTDELNVVFSVPEARISIRKNSPSPTGEWAEVVLVGRGGSATRQVVIRDTGQVYTR